MESIELLKNELLNQKTEIENKFGTVNVLYSNPSPAEITEGIKSIPIPDLSISTATEEDVAQGKTFFSGSSILKTGSAVGDTQQTNALFMAFPQTQTYESTIYYSIPEGMTQLKHYTFYNNYNKVVITFNHDIVKIGDYAFCSAIDFEFPNFNQLENITTLGMYAFQNCYASNINVSSLPNTIKSIGASCFMNVAKENVDYRLPNSVTDMGQSVFRSSIRKAANDLVLTNISMTSLPAYTFYNLAFNCDFVPGEKLSLIGSYFNYSGCFKNIYMPSTIKTLNTYSFGAPTSQALSDFFLKKVVFESETPPSFGSYVFATQNVKNGFKIYVPDTAVETYKAVTNLSPYVSCIYPVSEME